jgi:hypothetical protein
MRSSGRNLRSELHELVKIVRERGTRVILQITLWVYYCSSLALFHGHVPGSCRQHLRVHIGMGYGAMAFDRNNVSIDDGIRSIREEYTSFEWSLWPPSKCMSRLLTKLAFPPLFSINPGISCTTSNEYAHLSPSCDCIRKMEYE